MPAAAPRNPLAATCEDYNEDAQTMLPDTRPFANVAAKRAKPELVPIKSRRRQTHTADGDVGKMSRRPNEPKDEASSRKERKSAGLKINTAISDRESRPYSSGPLPERRRSSISRPAISQPSEKAEKAEAFFIHQYGQCRICDYYGKHIMEPLQYPGPSKDLPPPPLISYPPAPLPALQQIPMKVLRPEASPVQPRIRPSSSHRERPVSYHAGMSQESYHPLSTPVFPVLDWNVPPATMLPYGHAQYPVTPTILSHNHYPEYQQIFSVPYSQQAPTPPRLPPTEMHPASILHAQPIIQQPSISSYHPTLKRAESQKSQRHSRHPSLSREEDARRMPPPSRRLGLTKVNTSTSAAVSERRPDLPPSSYREPQALSYHTSLSHEKSAPKASSREGSERGKKVSGSAPGLDRRVSLPTMERNEFEAEDYQRSRGTRPPPSPLTAGTFGDMSRRSDSGSQHSANTSSRGSSGGKTKAAAANNDITMTFNGLTLGISGDKAETHSINIQPQRAGRHGRVSIRVNENEEAGRSNKVTSLQRRSGSVTSSSRQSRKAGEKEVWTPRAESSDRDTDRVARSASRSRKTSYVDSFGCGVGYG